MSDLNHIYGVWENHYIKAFPTCLDVQPTNWVRKPNSDHCMYSCFFSHAIQKRSADDTKRYQMHTSTHTHTLTHTHTYTHTHTFQPLTQANSSCSQIQSLKALIHLRAMTYECQMHKWRVGVGMDSCGVTTKQVPGATLESSLCYSDLTEAIQ